MEDQHTPVLVCCYALRFPHWPRVFLCAVTPLRSRRFSGLFWHSGPVLLPGTNLAQPHHATATQDHIRSCRFKPNQTVTAGLTESQSSACARSPYQLNETDTTLRESETAALLSRSVQAAATADTET
jgi:hypothetical protein